MDVPEKITLPDDALSEPTKNREDAFIINPIFEKKYLTIKETLSCINHLTAVLLADECYTSQAEHKRYL